MEDQNCGLCLYFEKQLTRQHVVSSLEIVHVCALKIDWRTGKKPITTQGAVCEKFKRNNS